jgi:hypothetical protein
MNRHRRSAARFPIGKPVITPAAQAALDAADISAVLLLARHVNGDRGTLTEEDRRQSDLALETGLRILSS